MSNNKATSGSQISHKYITHVSQASNNKTTNNSPIAIVTQKWRTLMVQSLLWLNNSEHSDWLILCKPQMGK